MTWREWQKEAVALAQGEDLKTTPEVGHIRALYDALKRSQQRLRAMKHENEAACQVITVLLVRLNKGQPYVYQSHKWPAGVIEIRRNEDIPPTTTVSVLQHKEKRKGEDDQSA